MTYLSTSGRKSELRSEYATFDWKKASKASICAFMLAFAPLTGAIAQTSGNADDDGYVAPVAPADDSGSDDSGAPAAAAAPAAAPAAAAPAASASVSSSSSPTTELGDIAVTGTAIARTDAATALPVTVISKKQLEAQGITSTDQALARLPSNNSDAGEAVGTGAGITGGGNFADLRGLGPRHTLVLLNGRRLSNDAFDGGAVDTNTIPFSAIDRIEVLRDGASALYGTDAVAGVINFITKKNLEGGNLSAGYKTPTRDGGGTEKYLEATFGHGDLDKDRYNVMITGSYRRQDAIKATDRDFVTVRDIDRGIDNTSSFANPGNYFQGASPNLGPAAPGCNASLLLKDPSGGEYCKYDYTNYGRVNVPSDRASVYARGTFKFNDKNKVSLSYLFAHNESRNYSAPGLTGSYPELDPSSEFYPGNGTTPLPSSYDLDTSEPINLLYRNSPLGARLTDNTNEAHRVVLNFTGQFEKIHYDTAFSYNQGSTDIAYAGGYFNVDQLTDLFNNGTVNPFAPASELNRAQRDAILSTQRNGTAESTKAREYTWDGKLSRELGNWLGGGQVAMAVGAQYRHQKLMDRRNNDYLSDIDGSGGGLTPGEFVSEDRDIESIYSELNVPVLDNLEIDGSFRYDHYSDFGNTVNPKVSLRYQPIDQVVIRGSYSEGFSAPTLYDLYQPATLTYTQSGLNDPKYCDSAGTPVSGAPAQSCNQQFQRQLGGNTELKPETSKSWTAGIIVSPIERMSLGVDFWWIELSQQVQTLTPTYILDNAGQYQDNIVRDSESDAISQINTPYANLGKTETNGVDFTFDYSLPTDYGLFNLSLRGTLTHKYAYQNTPTSDYEQAVGEYSQSLAFVIPKWKHTITLDWAKGPWSASLTNNFFAGYEDYDTSTHEEVNNYTTFDASVGYRFDSGIQLRLGSENLFDRDPPFSNQPDVGYGGYDARYADVYGRTVFGRLSYNF